MGVMGELIVPDLTGDTKIIWDSDKKAEVDNAREQFDYWKKKGYVIYSVKKDGEPGDVLHKFDPTAEKLIAREKITAG